MCKSYIQPPRLILGSEPTTTPAVTTCFHCSSGCCFTSLQTMLGIVHGDLRLVCSCLTMETYFMKLLMLISCADVTSRGTLELFFMTSKKTGAIYAPQASVLWCLGLPLHDWVLVTPICFHFTIKSSTFDQGCSHTFDNIVWVKALSQILHWCQKPSNYASGLIEGASNIRLCLWCQYRTKGCPEGQSFQNLLYQYCLVLFCELIVFTIDFQSLS